LPAAKAVPTAGKETPASRERFVVALGAYNDRNVKQLTTKISSAGYRAFTEKVPNKADQHRLRAGPFTTRAAAEEAREKLKAQGFADAVVRQDP
jgi:DedD protein